VKILAHHVEQHPPGTEGWLFVGQGTQPPHQNTVGARWPTAEDRTRKAADAMLAVAMTIPKDSPRTQEGSCASDAM
jgi:hypothetical protein